MKNIILISRISIMKWVNYKYNLPYKCVLYFLILFNSIQAEAQLSQPPVDSYISINGSSISMAVIIPDSSDISELEVNLGCKNEDSNIFNYIFIYDQYSGLPIGVTYSRSNMQVLLGLGNLSLESALNVQVRIKNNSGNWSSWFKYVSN